MRAKLSHFFFSPQPSIISEDEQNLQAILSSLKKWDKTKGSWIYQYAIPVAGWVTWGAAEAWWLSTEIRALINPAWKLNAEVMHRNDVAWNKGHADYVNFTHYDCSNSGHSAVIHEPDLQYDFACFAGPISTCCELTNGPNWVTAIGSFGFCIGLGVNSLLQSWGARYVEQNNQPVAIPEPEHSKIIELIQQDILDKYSLIPLSKQPVSTETIQQLTQDLQEFTTNPVKPEVLIRITAGVQKILSAMQKTQFPLSMEASTEPNSDEDASLLGNFGFSTN